MSHYNFGVRGRSLTKLWHLTCLGCGVNASTTFGGTAPVEIWESKKTRKNRCNLRQLLSLSANIFGIDDDSDKI